MNKKLLMAALIALICITTIGLYANAQVSGEAVTEKEAVSPVLSTDRSDLGFSLEKQNTKLMEVAKGSSSLTVTSTSDMHDIGDIMKTKEWGYEKAGVETVTSNKELFIKGNYVCAYGDYYIENKGTVWEYTVYTNCIYYPEQYVDKVLEEDVEITLDDGTKEILPKGTVVQEQVRTITQKSPHSVEISFEDNYDPTITEMQSGLVSYWTLDADATDKFGSNDGVAEGAVQATGLISNGYDFESGDTYDHVNISDDASLDITDAVSLSFWISPETLKQGYTVAKYQAYMCQMSDASGTLQCGIWRDVSGTPTWTVMAESSVNASEWTHVVFTYNSTAGGSTEAKLYLNNILVDTGDYSYEIDTSSHNLLFGNRNTDFARSYDGLVDEVGIWNRELSSDEVSELYNDGDGLQPLDDGTTVWTKETGSGCGSSWNGDSSWETSEYRVWIDNDNRDDSGDYNQIRYKLCAGTDSPLRVLNLSVCWIDDESPDGDSTCTDSLVAHEGDGTTSGWYYNEISQGTCEYTPWMDYDWKGTRNYFVQWGVETGSYDGNKYVNGCSMSRISRRSESTAHVNNPSWTSGYSWENYIYDLAEIQGRNSGGGSADEEEGREAIETGIDNSELSYPDIDEDVVVYVVRQNGDQEVGTYDMFASEGSKRWAFNYLTGSDVLQGLSQLQSVLFFWEEEDMTEAEIESSVSTYIDSTN